MLEIGELDTGGRGSPMSRPTPDASAIGKKWIAMVGSPTTRLDALAGACRRGRQGWKWQYLRLSFVADLELQGLVRFSGLHGECFESPQVPG